MVAANGGGKGAVLKTREGATDCLIALMIVTLELNAGGVDVDTQYFGGVFGEEN